MVDCTINIANNEGFGLTTAESLSSGTPIIVNVTGGLQDQCGFKKDGKLLKADDYIEIGSLHQRGVWEGELECGEWVQPLWSTSITLNGSPNTPYIFDDRIEHVGVVNAIQTMYDYGREERKRRGLLGRKYIKQHFSREVMCKTLVNGVTHALKKFQKKPRYELYKIV